MAPPGPTPKGPRELTVIVDLTRGEDHPTARLLDLVPGRSGTAHENWLEERGEDFRAGVRIARWIPSRDIRTPSMINSKTPPASSTPSISSSGSSHFGVWGVVLAWGRGLPDD